MRRRTSSTTHHTNHDPSYFTSVARDRADGSATRNPSLSYSNSYKSWRIAKLDGGLAYSFASGDDLPPTDQPFTIYNGLAPAPTLIIHKSDPRLKVPVWDMLFDK